MNINNNIMRNLTNLLTNFDFIEEVFKNLDHSAQVLLVEGVLHSAHPNAIVDALENRAESWTEGDLEAFVRVVEKANELWDTPLSHTQKAAITAEWIKIHGGDMGFLLAEIQDGIVQELTVEMFDKAKAYIQGLLDDGMWFSDACYLLQFSDKAYQLTGNQDNIQKFWDYLADRCVAPEGVTPKTESPLF